MIESFVSQAVVLIIKRKTSMRHRVTCKPQDISQTEQPLILQVKEVHAGNN